MNYKDEVLKVYPDAVYVHFPESVYFKHHIRLYAEETIKSIGVSNKSEEEAWNTAYLDLVPTPATIIVTGCGDCPMRAWATEILVYCLHPDHKAPTKNNYADLHEQCPLKTSPITIMLKK